jgi:SlyX protein
MPAIRASAQPFLIRQNPLLLFDHKYPLGIFVENAHPQRRPQTHGPTPLAHPDPQAKQRSMNTQILEEKLAHLMRTVDDLSDVVARQQTEIDRLTRRVEMLIQREADREEELSGGVIISDERPPHY